MNKVLVTGFEPFGGKRTNITKEALGGITNLEGVHAEILPVEFGRAAAIATAVAEDGGFDAILLLGERPSIRAVMGFETKAHNHAYAGIIPDNSGERRFGGKIHPNAPRSLSATMDYSRILETAGDGELLMRTQRKIGQFVCNDVFYRLLHAQKLGELDPDMQIGFAHIGSRTDSDAAQVALRRVAETLRDDTL